MKKRTAIDGHISILKKRARTAPIIHAVIMANRRVLHFTPSLAAVREMAELDFGFFIMGDAQRKLSDSIDFDGDPWVYQVDANTRELVIAPLTEDVSEKVHLLREKAWGIEMIIRLVERHQRHVLHCGELPLQHEIYRAKREQAKMVLDGYTDFTKTFHVHSWAEMANLSLDEAARSIIFKAEELDIDLFRIETMRLETCRGIRAATSKEEVHRIVRLFQDKAGASNA